MIFIIAPLWTARINRKIPTRMPPYFYGMHLTALRAALLIGIGISAIPRALQAQEPNTQVQMFGHVTANIEQENGESYSDFSLGEHDFFVQSKISPRISFLSETVVGPINAGHGASDYKVSIERARLKYQYREWLSIIVGKMHTPVNYWNDVYHHGRLFFPTIDRPRSFGTVVPIHTLGMRLQGQNIGALNFGYDLVLGNGMSSNDVTDGTMQKSLTAAVHIKPEAQTRIGFSAYFDRVANNNVGTHAGHGHIWHYHEGDDGFHAVDLDFQLYCFSLYRKKGKWETLMEASLNRTGLSESNVLDSLTVGLDTLGTSNNTTFYWYAGHKVGKRSMILGLVDLTHFEEIDLHIKSNQMLKFGVGYAHEFSPLVNVRVQMERYTGREGFTIPKQDKWELKFQVAYCIF